MPLVGCDQVGQNQGEEISSEASSELEKRAETTRYVAGTTGGRGIPPSGFGLYVEEGGADANTNVLHTCIDVDDDNKVEHVREETELESAQINDSGNLVETAAITEAEGAIYASGDEGAELEIETFDFNANGGYIQNVIRSTESAGPLNDEGNFDYFESTNGVPTSDQECRNRDQFLSALNNPPSRSDLVGTWRLNSSGNIGSGPDNAPTFDASGDDSFALFFDITSDETILHTCEDDNGDGTIDDYTKERAAVTNKGTNSRGYPLITEEIKKAEGEIFTDGNEGRKNDVVYFSVQDESAIQWVQPGSADNGGNVDGLEKTSGVPTGLSECQNKDQFIQ
jgi:hypothetical protein